MKLTFELWFTRCVSLKDVYWQGVLLVIAIIVLLVTYVIPVHHVVMTNKIPCQFKFDWRLNPVPTFAHQCRIGTSVPKLLKKMSKFSILVQYIFADKCNLEERLYIWEQKTRWKRMWTQKKRKRKTTIIPLL